MAAAAGTAGTATKKSGGDAKNVQKSLFSFLARETAVTESTVGKPVFQSATKSQLPTGLTYVDNFVSNVESDALTKFIDSCEWATGLARRVQEYGFTYHTQPAGATIDKKSPVGSKTTPIPKEFNTLCQRLVERKLMSRLPEQLIINEYEPGQGIGAHTDHTTHFGEEIVSISLLTDAVMTFESVQAKVQVSTSDDASLSPAVDLLLRRNSCVALSGDARHKWMHSIAKRKTDYICGRTIRRTRRLSLTFRHMLTTGV